MIETQNEPADYPQGYYHVRVEYASGHKPTVVDLAKLAEILPHGSGIDGDWTITVRGNGDICVQGEYRWRNFRFSLVRCRKTEYKELFPLWWCGVCSVKHYAPTTPTVCPFCHEEPSSGWVSEQQYQVHKVKGTVYLQAFQGGGDASNYLYDRIWQPLADEMGIRAIESIMVGSESSAKNYGK